MIIQPQALWTNHRPQAKSLLTNHDSRVCGIGVITFAKPGTSELAPHVSHSQAGEILCKTPHVPHTHFHRSTRRPGSGSCAGVALTPLFRAHAASSLDPCHEPQPASEEESVLRGYPTRGLLLLYGVQQNAHGAPFQKTANHSLFLRHMCPILRKCRAA